MSNTRLTWYGDGILKDIQQSLGMGLGLVLAEWERDGQEHVPFDTGLLASTSLVSVGDQEAAWSYDTDYAVEVHEHPERRFQQGREGKWVENVKNRRQGDIAGQVTDYLRKEVFHGR